MWVWLFERAFPPRPSSPSVRSINTAIFTRRNYVNLIWHLRHIKTTQRERVRESELATEKKRSSIISSPSHPCAVLKRNLHNRNHTHTHTQTIITRPCVLYTLRLPPAYLHTKQTPSTSPLAARRLPRIDDQFEYFPFQLRGDPLAPVRVSVCALLCLFLFVSAQRFLANPTETEKKRK